MAPRFDDHDLHVGYHKGYSLYRDGAAFYAHLSIEPHRGRTERAAYSRCFEATTLDAVKARIEGDASFRTTLALVLAKVFVVLWQCAHYLKRRKLSLLQSGAGRQGAVGPQPSFGARLKQRLAQFTVESRAIVDSLADLVPNLRRLGPGYRVEIAQCDGAWCEVSASYTPNQGGHASVSGYLPQTELWGVYADEEFD